jgi:hypothetical protein
VCSYTAKYKIAYRVYQGPWAKPPDRVGLSSPDVLALRANIASLSDQGSRVRLLLTN